MPEETKILRIPNAYKPGERMAESLGICIYGRSGVGKTTLVGTMPGRGLVVDIPQIEGGTFVLADKAERIDVVSVTTWDEIQNVYWFLAKEPHSYRWVAIDSITAMTELAKRKVVKERDKSSILIADPHQLSQPEWGKVGRFVGELVYQFRTLPIHTIWIAQERSYGGEDEPKTIGPDTTPSAFQMLKPSLTLIGRLSVEQGPEGQWERHLRIGPHPRYEVKARSRPGLDVPSVVRHPDLATLLRFMLGSGERPEEAQEGFIILG